jgi:hypothetical protein
MTDLDRPWYRPVAEMLAAQGNAGGFVVRFAEYRPDLVQGLAGALGLGLRDCRAELLAPLGWEAGRLPLAELDAWLGRTAATGGIVAQNVEALLAAKPEAEQRAWLAALLASDRPVPVVVPIVVLERVLPSASPRVVALAADAVPELTLLRRFLG